MSVVTNIYNCTKQDIFTGSINLAAAIIQCALYSTLAYTATNTTYSTVNELATANGYTIGGQALAGKAVAGTTTVTWKANPSQWTASGAGFTSGQALLYSSANARVIAHIDFGGNQTASGGGTFTLTYDATNGIFNVA
jgi:hypothetical protein